jgi:IS1 family transposase
MNKLSREVRVRVVAALVEGNSIRATVRMTGVAKNTVVKLLAELGCACAEYHAEHVRGVKATRVECDEIWSFVGSKEKHTTPEKKAQGWGDVWTWTAIEAGSKLILSWLVAGRDGGAACAFMEDVASRIANRIQLTTDGHKVYIEAVEHAFGGAIDYAMLIKQYGAPDREGEARYSPAVCTGCETLPIVGNPDMAKVSTSYVERQNLTMRMGIRRFTRLTNAFSKKIENHAHAVALHFMHYNFVRMHQTLRCTPAMAAKLTDHRWSLEEMVGLLEVAEGRKPGRGAA